jgi:ArsR family transcriptional regulator
MKTTVTPFTKEQFQEYANTLKVIAHPVKLQILHLLSEEEPLDVSTLCAKVGVGCEISMMSHHLAKMKDNGILTSEKIGKQVFYSIKDRKILNIFNHVFI